MTATTMRSIAALPVALVACLGLAGVGAMVVEGARPAAADVAAPSASPPATHGYRDAVRSLDDAIASESQRAALDPSSWDVQGTLASTYRSRAIVTGDAADYERAQAALECAFRLAPAGAGPFLARAQLHASLHRWDLMEPDLAAVEDGLPKAWQRATAIGLRGDYALQCGQYARAAACLQQAAALDPGPGRLCALAELRNTTGDALAADALLDQAERSCPRRDYPQRAWLRYERATLLLARGDEEGARAWVARAQAAMPGWWRADGLAADLDARAGDVARAQAADERLERATGNPLFMDALARIALARADHAAADRWTSLAWAVYAQQIATMPAAASAHALDHVLDLTHDGALAVTLAEANHALRPGGEAGIALARAYLLAGRIPDARAAIEAVLATPYALPGLHRVAAEVYRAAGDDARARAQDAMARPL